MEHIGIDVHQVESQICILTESSGETIERRIRHAAGAVRRSARRETASEDSHRGIDRERVGGAMPGAVWARGDRHRSELRGHVRDAQPLVRW